MSTYRSQRGKRLRLFIGEADEWRGKPLYQAVVEQAWLHGIRGVSVLRGIEGFGPEHHLVTDRLPDTTDNLPLIIDIVESDEHLEAFLPLLDQMIQRGMITATPVEIILNGEGMGK